MLVTLSIQVFYINLKTSSEEKIMFAWPLIILCVILFIYFFAQDCLFSSIKMSSQKDDLEENCPTFSKYINHPKNNDIPIYSFLCDFEFNTLLFDYSKRNLN